MASVAAASAREGLKSICATVRAYRIRSVSVVIIVVPASRIGSVSVCVIVPAFRIGPVSVRVIVPAFRIGPVSVCVIVPAYRIRSEVSMCHGSSSVPYQA